MCRTEYKVLVAMLMCCVQVAVAEDSDSVSEEAATFATRNLALTDIVLEKHIDPPVRQQMLLGGAKALYQAAKQPAPAGLSRRISGLASEAQIINFLDAVGSEFDQLPHGERIFANGMFATVSGRTFLLDAQSAKVGAQLGANRYVGTGIALSVSREGDRPAMPKVFYNGPAWRAGARNGDVIIEINGASTESKNLQQIVEELRGEDGSDVTVVLRRPDSEELRTLTITRGRVFIPSVQGFREKEKGQWQYTIDSASDIALLRFKSIGPSTLHELRQAAAKLQEQDIKGIVLDVRESGGLLHDTIMVADSLLDGGVIGHIRSADGVAKHEARPGTLFAGLPMAVLIMRQTGPGSVLLTAALQDNGRAVVVGERTTNVPYVSSLLPIPGRTEKIRIATAIMLRGDGTPLLGMHTRTSVISRDSVGRKPERDRLPGFILPDHEVQAGMTETEKGIPRDTMLKKAIEVLRNAAAQQPAVPATDRVSG